MIDKINFDINCRFFEAFDELDNMGVFGSKNNFYSEHKIDKRNFLSVRGSENRRVDNRVLSILVSKYYVDAHWLLTGEGSMFLNYQCLLK